VKSARRRGMRSDPVNWRLLVDSAAALQVLRGCIAAGGRDGCTGGADDTVDGLAWPVHAGIIAAMRDAVGLPAPP
jgi:hypothetical protein